MKMWDITYYVMIQSEPNIVSLSVTQQWVSHQTELQPCHKTLICWLMADACLGWFYHGPTCVFL